MANEIQKQAEDTEAWEKLLEPEDGLAAPLVFQISLDVNRVRVAGNELPQTHCPWATLSSKSVSMRSTYQQLKTLVAISISYLRARAPTSSSN